MPTQQSEQKAQTVWVLIVLALISATYLLVVDWDVLVAVWRQLVHAALH